MTAVPENDMISVKPRGEVRAMSEETFARIRIKVLASKIRNNQQLRYILLDADPYMRRAVYDMIRPNLRFKPKPYSALNLPPIG